MNKSVTGLLDPYIPSPTRPWDKRLATHLLNRTMFGAKVSDVNFILSMSPSEAVDYLFQSYTAPEPPGSWVTEAPDFNSPYNSTRMNQLRTWWVRLMYEQPISIREKMCLFWHNLFVSEGGTVIIPQYMYIQNSLIRQYALGNFKDFAKAITRDPGMLIYLDGRYNVVGNPNENYARELMELFTLGIGNYTETDIREGARALTGWILNGLGSILVPSRHDYGTKTILGQTGNFNDDDFVNIIFTQQACAFFLCKKFYKFFINQKEDMADTTAVINQLADLLRANNYNVFPVLKTLLKSNLFFSENVIGSLIKAPIDVMLGAIKQLDIYFDPSVINTRLNYVISSSSSAGQYILDPPNVQGWVGYRQWLSTVSVPVRNAFSESIITGLQKNGTPIGFQVDAYAFAITFPAPNDASRLVDDMAQHLLRLKLTPKQKQYLLEVLLDGTIIENWNINDPQAPSRIRKFLKALIYLAEYQLT